MKTTARDEAFRGFFGPHVLTIVVTDSRGLMTHTDSRGTMVARALRFEARR